MKMRYAVFAAAAVACADQAPTTTTPKQALSPPATVTAKIENGNIVLTWSDVPEATSYRVYMAAEAGVKRANYTKLPANMFHPDLLGQFNHPAGLDPNMKYFLVVTAVGADGESTESCEVAAEIATQLAETCS